MTDPEHDEEEINDPFSATLAPGVSLIVLLRLYDLLAGIYSSLEPDKATKLLEIHRQGKIYLDLPYLDL